MRPPAASALHHPLDDIFGSRAAVRVIRVLAEHGGRLGVSDIARRARLSLPSVRTALRRLLELDVVTAVAVGRSMACALSEDHPLVPALSAIYAAERKQTVDLMRGIRKAASTVHPAPLAIWLYGSVARGEDDFASDIDVAIISSRGQPTRQAERLREAIGVTLPERSNRISVVALGPADLRLMVEKRSAFWREIERDTVVLSGDAPGDVRKRFMRSRKRPA